MPPTIFISYSSKDRTAAEALENKLEKAGVSVWRDKARLETDWSREIAEALAQQADAPCLLWSANAAESRWVKHEWLTARALEKRIFPCMLDGAPDLAIALSTLDAVAYPTGLDLLIERIRSADGFRYRYNYTTLPANAHIPFNPNPEFEGRQADLLELYLKMVGNLKNIGVNQVGTLGMGGIGKTQLVVEFAYRFSFAFDGILWLNAAEEDKWRQQFVEIARDWLGLAVEDPAALDASERYWKKLQKYCREHPQTLLIMDNVARPEQLNSKAVLDPPPLSLGCNLLFTTRRRFTLPGVLEQPVDILSPGSAYTLLTSALPPASAEEGQAASEICDAVGWLPLALVLIAGFLRHPKNRERISYSRYLAKLRQKGLDVIDLNQVSPEQLATRHKAAVSATLDEHWRALEITERASCFGQWVCSEKRKLSPSSVWTIGRS